MATVAIGLPVLLGMVGFAVDMGRLYVAKARLQAAVDAAALAGSLQLLDDPELEEGRVANAVSHYLARNYPEARVVDISSSDEIRSVNVRARVDVPMTFMTVLGIRFRSVDSSAAAGFNDLEIALVVDNTGSMVGEPIEGTKEALHKLVDFLIPQDRAPSIKIGLVPFRGKVHVGNFADGQEPGCRNADGTVNHTHRASCFEAIPPILPLTQEKARIHAAIDRLEAPLAEWASSGTVISEGLRWGRHVLTPEFPYQEGGDPAHYRKVIILVSDGANDDGECPGATGLGHRNAYFGMGVKNCNCQPHGCLDRAVQREAELAKETYEIEIFVVRFGDSEYDDIRLLKYVSSSKPDSDPDNHYYDAPTIDDINEMFKQISRQLGLRIIT